MSKLKICRNCLIEKSIDDFCKVSKSKDGHNGECKVCQSIGGKNAYKKNKNEINAKRRKKYNDNPEPVLKHQREYYANNKDKKQIYARNNKERIKENRRKNDKKKQQDIFYRIRIAVKSSIRYMLFTNNSGKAGKSFLPYVGWIIYELIKHLEDNFDWWMNWNNYGKYDPKTWDDNDPITWRWQIDHIIPQSDLPYDSMDHLNFRVAWALFNLRPYSAKLNLLEGASKIRHIPNRDLSSRYKFVKYTKNNK